MKKFLVRLVDRLEKLPGEPTTPNFCCFGITDACMLRCRMCYKWQADAGVQPHDTMPSPEQWKEAVVSLRRLTGEGFLINFGGGEPFLYEGILDVVRCAADQGFKTNIATNAVLIDEERARRIGASGLSTVNISLDSYRESMHDFLRGVPGVYRQAFRAIDYLEHYAPGLEKGICTVLYGSNLDDIPELIERIQTDDRLDWIYFMAAMQPNNTAPDPGWYRGEFASLWPQDKQKVEAVLEKIVALKNKGYKIVNQLPQLKAFRSYFLDPERFIKTARCNLSRAIHISAVGDVYICFRWERLGNIRHDRLEDLWHSARATAVRQRVAGCKHNCHFLLNCFFEGDFPYLF